MPLDIQQILQDSLSAAKNILTTSFKDVKPFAEHEFQQYAEDIEHLIKLKLDGTIPDDEFKARVGFVNLGFTNILLAIKGIGILEAQNIVNAVIAIVSKAVSAVFSIALP